MAPRHNACRVMLRVPDAPRASKAHQPEHQQLAQRGSGQQSTALLQTDVDTVNVPLLRVSLRRSATLEHDLPALHTASRRQAVQGMRHQLCHKFLLICKGKRRMAFDTEDEFHPAKKKTRTIRFKRLPRDKDETGQKAAERQGRKGSKGGRGTRTPWVQRLGSSKITKLEKGCRAAADHFSPYASPPLTIPPLSTLHTSTQH